MANKIQIRRGLKSNLPTLSSGELAYTTDTRETFVGTGSGNVNMSGSVWYTGTAMSGNSMTTNAYSYSDCPLVKVGDKYLNTENYNLYECTTSGSGTSAKWTYKCCLGGNSGGTNISYECDSYTPTWVWGNDLSQYVISTDDDGNVTGIREFVFHLELPDYDQDYVKLSGTSTLASGTNIVPGYSSNAKLIRTNSNSYYFGEQNASTTMYNYFGQRTYNGTTTITNNFGGAPSTSYRSGLTNKFGEYAYYNYFGSSAYYNYFGSSATISYYYGNTIYLGSSTSYPVYMQGSTSYKVVGTTSGYNTKIHIKSTDPDDTMKVGDLWFKTA